MSDEEIYRNASKAFLFAALRLDKEATSLEQKAAQKRRAAEEQRNQSVLMDEQAEQAKKARKP